MGLISRVSSRTYRDISPCQTLEKPSLKCRHVRGHATGRHRRRHPGSRETQHRKRYCRVHQEGVRQEVQPDLALHCWQELWVLRYPRDKALYLLLSGASRYFVVQIRINFLRKKKLVKISEKSVKCVLIIN